MRVPGDASYTTAHTAQPSATRGDLAVPEASLIHSAVFQERPVLEIEQFSLWYGPVQALFDVTMPVPSGRVTALIGPSGCGKSTLIRSVNRLNDLVDSVRSSGQMRLNGESIHAPAVDVIALRKRIGMVFQRSNPFPMSIYENVVYPLRIDGESRRSVLDDAVERSLKSAALWDEVKDRLSHGALELSGGQQQRLCIARAIAPRPEVILMDEPCSALDPIATARIEELILSLRDELTVLIVTHNMQQAGRVSDYTAFMYLGRLVEYGPTRTIFLRPERRQSKQPISPQMGTE